MTILRSASALLVPLSLVASCLVLGAGVEEACAQGTKRLTLEQASGRADGPSFRERVPDWSWAPDGVHLVLREGGESRWFDPDGLREVEAPGDEGSAAEETGDTEGGLDRAARLAEALGLEPEDAARAARRPVDEAGGTTVHRLSDGHAFVGADGAVGRLTGGEEVELVDVSPDGTRVAFVRAHDLWVQPVAEGSEARPLTGGGGPKHLHGKLDWVYQEEVYGRGRFQGYWWSPDSTRIAFLDLDEAPVYDFTVIDHIEEGHFRVKPEITSYPKAGDPNPIARLGLVDVASGEVRAADLERFRESEPLLVRVGWDPAGARCLVTVQDRIQTWAELVAVDPASGATTTLLREESESWVDRPDAPRWLADGDFLWSSHRTGYTHLYRYAPDGTLRHALTRGDHDVLSIQELDEEAGTALVVTREGDATGTQVARVRLDGGGARRLTQDLGTHRVDFREDGAFFLDRLSSLAEPTEVRLCRGSDGALVKVLGRGDVPDAEEWAMGRWERLVVPTRDGFELDVALLKPVPFDPSRKHPVWIPTYSGPGAPSVRNRWNSSAWYQFLAQQGVVVMQVNVRTASNKGHVSTARGYLRFGVQEVLDMEDAVAWLTSHDWADAARVGITGGSYGGFMTARCLLTSDRFRLGIASSGVYDWRMYDTIYTERYMSTPQRNGPGYAETSCLNVADGLTGYLHLVHGTMDDNVHLQNLMHLTAALMAAGKTNWSQMVYPQTRHGIRDREMRWHARRTEWDLIRQHLRPGAGEAADAEAAERAFDDLIEGGR